MHLEPVEIQHVKLRRGLLGYDRAAVDQLLENVTASYEDVWFERAKLEAELASLRNRLDGQAQAKEALEGSVKAAQGTADDLLDEARAKAQAVVDEAHHRAQATLGETQAEYQRLQVEIKKLEVSETEITLRLRALLTAARELLDGHESIRQLATDATAPEPSASSPTNGTHVPPEAAQQEQAPPVQQPEATPERAEPVESPDATPPPAAPVVATPVAARSEPEQASAEAAVAAAAAALTATRVAEAPAPAPVEAPPAAEERGADEDDEAHRIGPDPTVASRATL